MSTNRLQLTSGHRRLPRVAALLAAMAIIACRDSSAIRQKMTAPTPEASSALLELSTLEPDAGEIVRMRLSIPASVTTKPVGSFTAQVAYDTTALTFLEVEPSSEALVAVNPVVHVVRIAGVAPKGFANGALATLKFSARRRSGIDGTSARLDELHATDRTSALATLATREVKAQLMER